MSMTWMTMDTAPRDGTLILGYQPAYEYLQEEFVVVFYEREDEAYPWMDAGPSRSGRYRITRWAPLVAPSGGG